MLYCYNFAFSAQLLPHTIVGIPAMEKSTYYGRILSNSSEIRSELELGRDVGTPLEYENSFLYVQYLCNRTNLAKSLEIYNIGMAVYVVF